MLYILINYSLEFTNTTLQHSEHHASHSGGCKPTRHPKGPNNKGPTFAIEVEGKEIERKVVRRASDLEQKPLGGNMNKTISRLHDCNLLSLLLAQL